MILIRAGNPSQWTGPTGNNTWLLPGRVPALVDAGVGRDAHLASIEGALEGEPLALVLITHGHSDHVAGLPALQRRWPSVRTVSAATIADGESIEAGNGTLRAVATPGHSPDHLCFYDEGQGDLFCGDLVRTGGTIVIPATRGGNLREYLASLRLVRDLAPRRLLPGHGDIITNPEQVIDQYVQHRAEREQQVLDALHLGPATAEAIAARIYGRLPAAIAGAAVESALAHLIKLSEEGRATRAASPSEEKERDPSVWSLSASRRG
jgi:glyoxylase-like metal-dependent hydrolase (beta-lactamase superfamily II)